MCRADVVKLVYYNDALFVSDRSKLSQAMQRVLTEGNNQEIANVLWSYADLGYRNDTLFVSDGSELSFTRVKLIIRQR